MTYVRRALEDRVMRMRRMADEAMDAVVGEVIKYNTIYTVHIVICPI